MPWTTKPFAQWNSDDLKALLDEPRAEENQTRDFKVASRLLVATGTERNRAREDLLKDVAAMANGDGGALLFGIDEETSGAGRPTATRIDGIEKAGIDGFEKAIKDLVRDHLDTSPAALRTHAVDVAPDRVVLIVEIQQNVDSLSMVTFDGRNQFWIRRGWENRLMTTDEVRFKFGEFARMKADVWAELDAVRVQVERTDVPLIWFAAIPVNRASDHVPVAPPLISAVLKESSYRSEYRSNSSANTFRLADYLAPTLRGIGIGRRVRASFDNGLEIRRDGTVLTQFRWPHLQTKPIPLAHVYDALASGLALTSDLNARFNVGRSWLLAAGLCMVHGRRLAVDEQSAADVQPFETDHVPLDACWMTDAWEPRAVFMEWAVQLANSVGAADAFALAPWVTPMA